MFSTAQAAVPQQDSPPIRTIPIPHPLTITLRDHSVHRELKLRTDKVQAVTTAIEEVEGPLWRLRDLPPEQRNPQAESLVEKLRERLRRILSQQQLERLDQIVWQIRGIVSFLEPGTVVTVPRTMADIVVTEYGIAYLKGKTQRERAEELIAVAHPDFKDELKKTSEKLYGV